MGVVIWKEKDTLGTNVTGTFRVWVPVSALALITSRECEKQSTDFKGVSPGMLVTQRAASSRLFAFTGRRAGAESRLTCGRLVFFFFAATIF